MTVGYFGMKPKTGEKEITPSYVFMVWFEFCSDFKTIWKRESKNLSKERLKMAQASVSKLTSEKKVETKKINPTASLSEKVVLLSSVFCEGHNDSPPPTQENQQYQHFCKGVIKPTHYSMYVYICVRPPDTAHVRLSELASFHWYENLIFDKDAKTVKWKKESIFNKWCWHNWMATCRRLQIDPYLSPCTKLKSKWIKDLNINPVTLNLIEEKVGSTLERIGTGDHFLNITPTAQTLSATINQWDYMKLRSFCKAKDTITKTKHQPTEWEKIFTNPTSDRGLISRIYKELKKHDIKTPNSPIEKWAIELNREFTAEEYRMAERTLKEMLNILTHQRNANQNNSKIPSYTCQNG
ncbi:hypothetical protein STEG23_036601 [Scotinomys teguina]